MIWLSIKKFVTTLLVQIGLFLITFFFFFFFFFFFENENEKKSRFGCDFMGTKESVKDHAKGCEYEKMKVFFFSFFFFFLID